MKLSLYDYGVVLIPFLILIVTGIYAIKLDKEMLD